MLRVFNFQTAAILLVKTSYVDALQASRNEYKKDRPKNGSAHAPRAGFGHGRLIPLRPELTAATNGHARLLTVGPRRRHDEFEIRTKRAGDGLTPGAKKLEEASTFEDSCTKFMERH